MKLAPANESSIAEAAEALASGLLVAFPTETVYGLGADALNKKALARLFAAKGRPADHPVIVHISSAEQLGQWACSVPEAACALAESFWPGPLTLVLPKASHVPDQVTGGQQSVGLRVPGHPVAQALLHCFGKGVAAPSANKFGKVSATCASHVVESFQIKEIALVLDGGPCTVGIESTIVDFSAGQPAILRPGMILNEQIEAVIAPYRLSLQVKPTNSEAEFPCRDKQVRAPGGMPCHYAPATPVCLMTYPQIQSELTTLAANSQRACVLSFRQKANCHAQSWIVAPADAYDYARQLYDNLRTLDSQACHVILVEAVPETSDWAGIADRLKRASAFPSTAGKSNVQ